MLAPGQQRQNQDDYRHASGCPNDTIRAIELGLDYARECLAQHDAALGRTTPGNRAEATNMEQDICSMERTLAVIRNGWVVK